MPPKLDDHASARDKLLVLYQRLTLDSRKHFQGEIALDLGCSPQTVTRLIGVIEKHLGKDVEIESALEGRRRYYRLKSKAEEKALGFSFEELRYLATCRDLAGPFLPKAVTDRINSSLTTLALLLGERAARSVSGMSIGFHGKGFIDYSPHLNTIAILNKAIEKRSICSVLYRPGGRREEITYRYAPGRILAMGGTLYVQGHRLAEHSVMTERPTTFSLHRIIRVAPTGEYFRFDAADGDACAFGLNWHEPRRMQVRVAPSAGDYVRDRVWSDDQIIEDTDDGGVLLSVTTTSEKELLAWVHSFGGAAQLIGGEEMVVGNDIRRGK
ncbi:MAG TPA: WYL domain-containing protein [Acetobacteraceae bacterium]|nr:WYL domain-containing protein [Acetobacteraceae bacterium]